MLIVLAVLLLLNLLPGGTIGGHVLRRVDILGDVRPVPEVVSEPDSLLPPPPKVKPAFVDTCRSGMTCIEDYSDSTLRGMTPFYRALDELAAKPRPVRIAYFGDSFIEADILTADLRAMLQERYGGCGVGFVTITSPVNGYRPTVRHSFGGWQSHSVTDSVFFDRGKQGVSGHYFIPTPGAYVELGGQRKYASRLDTCERASIFFYNKGEARLSASVNKGEPQTGAFPPADGLREMNVTGRIGSVRWKVESADSTLFYGVAMDGTQGIAVDNFSLRGSSGLSLRSIPVRTMREFNELRPYDLIVLQYGLNVATERGRNYDRYRDGMLTTIAHLKQAFPQAGILIVGVGDREYKTEEGSLRTMPGIKNLIRYQQNLAADSGVDQLATYGIDAKSFIAAYLDGFDYRIDEVKVDGDSATATVVLTCKKFDAFAQALTEATTALAEDGQTAELDADQINEKVGQLVLEALGSVEPTESNPVELPFTRTDNAWGPASGAEQALSTALFSG